MYVCKECDHLFDEPRKMVERHGLDSPPYEEFHVCPSCSEQAFTDAFECAECGEYITDRYIRTESGATICDDCYVSCRLCED